MKKFIITLSVCSIGLIFIFVLIKINAPYIFFPKLSEFFFDKEEHVELIREFKDYGKIYQIDDAERCYSGTLNNEYLRINKFKGSESPNCISETENYKVILDSLEIDLEKYLYFRKQISDLGFIEYCSNDELHIFQVGGLLDSSWGYLYSKQDLKLDEKLKLCGISVTVKKDIGDDWYLFSGWQ